ncbi:MAG TPA: TetR/AcrR family transcriptional regulator [Cytophagaceae bacterium]|jgi:AcrR family transcriptional regulator|nr:TetR/AcrR family transcriptional regulator [Cytophagaceae bacterium]
MEPKDIILKGALDMFLRYGVKSITMDDISRTLGVSKKTIYQYFEDKDALVCACVSNFTEFQKESFIKMRDDSKDALEELIKCSDFMRSSVCNINPALLYDVKKYHPRAWAIYLDYRREFVEKCIQDMLHRGVGDGLFRANIDTAILARMRIETVEMGFNTEVFPLSEFETPKVQMEFFEHFTFGICTIKGHKLLNKYKQIHEED